MAVHERAVCKPRGPLVWQPLRELCKNLPELTTRLPEAKQPVVKTCRVGATRPGSPWEDLYDLYYYVLFQVDRDLVIDDLVQYRL